MKFAFDRHGAFISVLVVLCFNLHALAQSEGNTALINDVELLQQRLSPTVFETVHRTVLLELDELKRIGKLEPTQSEQLRIAARGAAESALEEWFTEHGATIRPDNQSANQAASAIEQNPDQQDKPVNAGTMPMMRLVAARRIGPPREAAVGHRIWRSAVQAILKTEQQERVAKAKSTRTQFRQDAEVRRTVAQLDVTLRLSEEQREAFLKILRPKLFNGWLRSQPDVIELSTEIEQLLLVKLTVAQKEMWNELKKQPRTGSLLIQVS